ncbi:hypothetical protein [Streptomyces sp. TE33382]
MLADYRNTLLIRELNEATNAALERIGGLTEELETLRGDRDEERRRRIALQQQIDSLKSRNRSREAEKHAAIAQRDEIRAGLAKYERDQQVTVRQPGVDQAGSHEHHPRPPASVPSATLPSDRRTKRRGLVQALTVVGVVVVSLAVYGVTQLTDNQDDNAKGGTAGTSPTPTPPASPGGSAGRPDGTTPAGTPATPPVAGDGPAHGGNPPRGRMHLPPAVRAKGLGRQRTAREAAVRGPGTGWDPHDCRHLVSA